MTSVSLITSLLPEDLHDIAKKFTIPESFLENETPLIEMILRSRSVDTDEEKQNWFNLLPMMNNDQLSRLRDILVKEKEKLEEIEKKYEDKKKEIKEKYINTWEEKWYIKKVEELKSEEEEVSKKEEEEAESLLDMI